MYVTSSFQKYLFGFIFLLVIQTTMYSQTEEQWFFFRAKDTLFNPQFDTTEAYLTYTGNDKRLRKVLEGYKISAFKKTYRGAKKEDLKKTFFVIADRADLLNDILRKARHLFEFGELVREEDKKIFEPNDYGLSSTIGENIGLPVDLTYLDDINMPKAWYYTTGSPDIKIGISDGYVDTSYVDFKGKTKMFKRAPVANGHGYNSAANAAAQGNNGAGTVGVCYDCGMYSTTYGAFKNLKILLDLSNAGAKVINCSWLNETYYETAQAAIDEMYDNGTIIVAAAGNKNWGEVKDNRIGYPASYDKVISVSVGYFRNKEYKDVIGKSENGSYYAQNVYGFVGRSLGFKNNDTTVTPHIWHVSTSTFNEHVDILAPSTGQFILSEYLLHGGQLNYHEYSTTSGATPFVAGTVGLMFSLYPCLPLDEVESILKLASVNIDHIEANKVFEGTYGSGLLDTGGTIELLYKLYSEDEIATLQGQHFSRWNFNLTAFSKEVVLTNQKFTGESTLDLVAKNSIVISKNTVLKPNSKGEIKLRIDPTLQKSCELRLRQPRE